MYGGFTMYGTLARYAIFEMLDAEDKAYRSKQQDVSDNKTNIHENKKRSLTGAELNALKQLDTCIKEVDKIRGELDKLEYELKKIGSA